MFVLGFCVCVATLAAAEGAAKKAEPAPNPPVRCTAVRVGPGVIGVEWRAPKRTTPAGYVVLRSDKLAGPYAQLAERPADTPHYLDSQVEPDTVYFYQVVARAADGTRSSPTPPACAWDNDQLVPNGSFELDSLGPMERPHCPLWWKRRAYNAKTPVLIRPGGPDGSQCVEVRSNTSDCISGGFHSILIPMIEGETWYQEAWARSLPGAQPRVGRCRYGEDRNTLPARDGNRAYDYATRGAVQPDGWTKYAGHFTATPGTCYVQIWIIGFRTRNTFWFDGVKLIDLTSKRVREFETHPTKKIAVEFLASQPEGAESAAALRALESEMARVRDRMRAEADRLTPLEYRRLLVELDRLQQQFPELVWHARILDLLKE